MNIKTVVNRCVRIAVATMALCCLNGCAPVLLAVYCLPYNTYQRLHEKKIDFSGRLIDQNGEPVAQAKVQYCIEGYGLARPVPRRKSGEVVSNDDGYFDIHGGRGCVLFIDKVEKRGYEFRRGGQKASFGGVNIHLAEHEIAKEPVVFHLRKKHAEAVYLVEKKVGISFKGDEKWFAKDFEKGWVATLENKNRMESEEFFGDWEVTGEKNPEKQEWTIHIKMNGENAGIQIGDKMLYEAPADGYEKEITFTLKCQEQPFDSWDKDASNAQDMHYQQLPKYLYLRLRNPGMYSRLVLDHAWMNKESINLQYNVVINPYGSRSLEPLLSIYDLKGAYQVTKEEHERSRELYDCRKEAEKAMKEQRLAPRPPFEQWIDEGKAFY